jgi:hypothetical protein
MTNFDSDFDPYNELVELRNFAKAADVHITNLVNNEKQIIKAVNEISEQVKQVRERIKLMDRVLQELAKEKTDETTRQRR